MAAQIKPTQKPATTCERLCWRRIMRQVPSRPATKNTRQSHHTGLKPRYSAKANRAPPTPPMAAVWVEIFHHTLMIAQTICSNKAAMMMALMKWGMCRRSIR